MCGNVAELNANRRGMLYAVEGRSPKTDPKADRDGRFRGIVVEPTPAENRHGRGPGTRCFGSE